MKRLTLGAIRVYQRVLSPYTGGMCRYEPTCSQYSYEAIQRHGVFKGMWLATKRLSRCVPWGGKGYNPVP